MFNSAQFEKLNFETFSKNQLKENKLRSINGGRDIPTMHIPSLGPTDTMNEDGCTSYIDPSRSDECDACIDYID